MRITYHGPRDNMNFIVYAENDLERLFLNIFLEDINSGKKVFCLNDSTYNDVGNSNNRLGPDSFNFGSKKEIIHSDKDGI